MMITMDSMHWQWLLHQCIVV